MTAQQQKHCLEVTSNKRNAEQKYKDLVFQLPWYFKLFLQKLCQHKYCRPLEFKQQIAQYGQHPYATANFRHKLMVLSTLF